MFSRILKVNPYHDALGNFTTKDKSVEAGSGRVAATSGTAPSANVVDVFNDEDNDGVTDSSIVGVPGMQVPPLPPIPRLPNLNPTEQAAQDKFASDVEKDPNKMAEDFRQMVYASKNPTTFGTDDAKMLTEEWSGEPGAERSARRATLNTALHQAANAVAKRAFLAHLDTLKEGDEVFVTVGGCGAGKGFALGNVPLAKEMAAKAKAVWDSAGDQNATENPWIQKEAEKRGLKVTYAYVNADPEVSWADPGRGVIKRANNPADGRMVDAHVFADSYAIGAQNHNAFANRNRNNPNASFIYIDSSKGTPTQVDSMPASALNVDRKKLTAFAVQAVKDATVPDSIKTGSLAGERIWGSEPAQKADDMKKKPEPAKEPVKEENVAYTWEQYEQDEIARLEDLGSQPQAGTYGGGGMTIVKDKPPVKEKPVEKPVDKAKVQAKAKKKEHGFAKLVSKKSLF